MNHPYKDLESHPLWKPIAEALSELESNQDLKITTRPEYVIGFLIRKALAETSATNSKRELKPKK
jgi:hypothetical protein